MAHTTKDARSNAICVGGPGPATRAWFREARTGAPALVVDQRIVGGESEYAGIIRALGRERIRFASDGRQRDRHGADWVAHFPLPARRAELIATPHWSEKETTPTEGEDA